MKLRWPWRAYRSITLGNGTVRLGGGVTESGRAYVLISPRHPAVEPGDLGITRYRPRRKDVVLWLDGELSAAQMHDAIDDATLAKAAHRHRWQKVGKGMYKYTITPITEQPE